MGFSAGKRNHPAGLPREKGFLKVGQPPFSSHTVRAHTALQSTHAQGVEASVQWLGQARVAPRVGYGGGDDGSLSVRARAKDA